MIFVSNGVDHYARFDLPGIGAEPTGHFSRSDCVDRLRLQNRPTGYLRR